MKGTMITYKPDGSMVVRQLVGTPDLDTLQAVVEGPIEHIAYFDDIELGDKRFACCAFCHEEGKLNELPINHRATQLWERSLKRKELTLYSASGMLEDYLVGNIVVIYGDDELMKDL